MDNTALVSSLSTLPIAPSRPQSAAALLPAEIVDCIFSHFDFRVDYSLDAEWYGRVKRDRFLSRISIVADGWTGPARRLLCRTVEIRRWEQLTRGVPEWARRGVRNLRVDTDCWRSKSPESAANALFGAIKNTPNLRQLALTDPGFTSLNDAHSKLMRTTQLLPHLVDLSIFDNEFPHSLIFDLLATSGRGIHRLTIWTGRFEHSIVPADERLDFGGNLRYLCIRGMASPPDVFQPIWSSLAGLREVILCRVNGRWRNRAVELLQTVAPSLEKLTIETGDIGPIIPWLPQLPLITHLSIPSPPTLLQSFLLPPRLIFLQFPSDANIGPLLDCWSLNPAVLPASLQQIDIKCVYDYETFERLPSLAKFCTVYRVELEDRLRRFAPRTLPFRALEVYFEDYFSNKIAVVEAECERLEVKFCRRHERWD